jgi:hypothetical protein
VHDVGAFRGRVFIAMAFVGDVELAAYNLGNLEIEAREARRCDRVAARIAGHPAAIRGTAHHLLGCTNCAARHARRAASLSGRCAAVIEEAISCQAESWAAVSHAGESIRHGGSVRHVGALE